MSNYESFNSENYSNDSSMQESASKSHNVPPFGMENNGFRVHLIVYCTIIGFLAFIDFLTGMNFWFVWPAISWGIGLSIHFWVGYASNHYQTTMARGLSIHGAVQGTLIVFFALVDYFSTSPLTWFFYPSLPLLFAWICHLGVYQFRKEDDLNSKYKELFEKELIIMGNGDDPRNRFLARKSVMIQLSFYVHAVVYLAAVGFFFAIDYFSNPGDYWFYWPVLPWGLGLLMHALGANHNIHFYRQKPLNKWYNLSYPGGVCAFLAAIDFLSTGSLDWVIYPAIPIMCIAVFVVAIVQQPKNPVYTPISKKSNYPTSLISKTKFDVSKLPYTSIQHDNNDSYNADQITNQNQQFCASCGGPLDVGYKFCKFCGKKIRQH